MGQVVAVRALQALESGDLAARACDEGERQLGDLVSDHETLAYMLKLARQVNRDDLANRYAHELVKRFELSQAQGIVNTKVALETRFGTQAIPFGFHMMGAQRYLVSATTTSLENGSNVTKASEYELIFKAFIDKIVNQ